MNTMRNINTTLIASFGTFATNLLWTLWNVKLYEEVCT